MSFLSKFKRWGNGKGFSDKNQRKQNDEWEENKDGIPPNSKVHVDDKGVWHPNSAADEDTDENDNNTQDNDYIYDEETESWIERLKNDKAIDETNQMETESNSLNSDNDLLKQQSGKKKWFKQIWIFNKKNNQTISEKDQPNEAAKDIKENLNQVIKEKFNKWFNRNNLFIIILIPVIGIFVLYIIKFIPYTTYRQTIKTRFERMGFNTQISGAAYFDPFHLSYEINNIELSLKSAASQDTCSSGISIVMPKVIIHALNGRVTVENAKVTIINQQGSDGLYASIMQELRKLPEKMYIKNAKISVESGCNDDNKKEEVITNDMMANDNVRVKVSNLLKINHLTIDKEGDKIDGTIVVEQYPISLHYDKNGNKVALEVTSSILQVKMYYDRDAISEKYPDKNIGYYSIESNNVNKILPIIMGLGNQLLHQIFSSSELIIKGNIQGNNLKSTSSGDIYTRHGTGKINITVSHNDMFPQIVLFFDKIDLQNATSSSQYHIESLWSGLFYQWILRHGHDFTIKVNNINSKAGILSNLLINYNIKDNNFNMQNFSAAFEDSTISLVESNNQKDAPEGQDNVKVNVKEKRNSITNIEIPIKFEGSSYGHLVNMVSTFVGRDNIMTARDDIRLPYKGDLTFVFSKNGNFGVKNFQVGLGEGSFSGHYLYNYSDGKNGNYTGYNKSISLKIVNFDLESILPPGAILAITGGIFTKGAINDSSNSQGVYFKKILLDTATLMPTHITVEVNDGIWSNNYWNVFISSYIKPFGYSCKGFVNNKDKSIDGRFDINLNAKENVPNLKTIIFFNYLNWEAFVSFANKLLISNEKVENISQKVQNIGRKNISGSILNDLKGEFDIQVDHFILKSDLLNELKLYSIIEGKKITIDRLFLKNDEQIMDIVGKIKPTADDGLEANFNYNGSNIQVDNIISWLTKLRNISGKAFIKGFMHTQGKSIYELIKNSTAEAELEIKDLTLDKFDLSGLSKALIESKNYSSINPTAITEAHPMKFSSVSGILEWQEGQISTPGLQMKTVGVSGLTTFHYYPFYNHLSQFETQCLILAKDPRPDHDYIPLPLVIVAESEQKKNSTADSNSDDKTLIHIVKNQDRVVDYLNAMVNLQKKMAEKKKQSEPR